ncbi:MAG: DUF1587 domain-containing protein [Planctomycetaceae bacterium]
MNGRLLIGIGIFCSAVHADDSGIRDEVNQLLQDSCVRCHDASTDTEMNFDTLSSNLHQTDTFRRWQSVYDRILSDEMPPPAEPRPNSQQRQAALKALKERLTAASLSARKGRGRVPARRLTRTEYSYTIQDLLQIEGEFGTELPEESPAGSFDTVAREQRFSAMHIEGFLQAAESALNAAIRLHRNPWQSYDFDLLNNEHLNSFHDRELRIGGNISRKTDHGVVLFRDVDYLLRSDLHGFMLDGNEHGRYRITIEAEAFQSDGPVAMKVVTKDLSGDAQLVQAFDLQPNQAQRFETEAELNQTTVFYIGMEESAPPALILADIYDAGGARKYAGPGVMIRSVHIEGPLGDEWPPQSTRRLLTGLHLLPAARGRYTAEFSHDPSADLRRMVERFGELAFRRPVSAEERNAFVELTQPALAEGRPAIEVVRIPLKAILCSPEFLLLTGDPGPLDDFSLASRLSYFLWKSLPGHNSETWRLPELFLTRTVAQVDRMPPIRDRADSSAIFRGSGCG